MCIKPVDFLLKGVVELIRPSLEDLGIFLAFLGCLFLGVFEGILALVTLLKDLVERIETSFPETTVSLF